MARLWQTGFEANSTTAWVEFSGDLTGTGSISTTQKHAGTYAFRSNPVAATGYISHQVKANANSNRYYARIYVYIAVAPIGASYILSATSAGGGTGLRLNTDRTVNLMKQDGTVLGSASSAIPLNEWHYLEIDIQSNAATSAKLDGTQFATGTNGSMGSWATMYFGLLTSCTGDVYFDDIAVNDTTGSNQASYPGEGAIVHLYPNGAGNTNTLKTSGGGAGSTTNYESMDEITPDDNTTYLKTTATADDLKADTYALEDATSKGIGSSDTITLVAHRSRKYLPYTNSWAGFQTRIRYNATNVDSAVFSVDTASAWRTYTHSGAGTPATGSEASIYYVAPGGGTWTPTILDSTEAGIVSRTNTFNSENRFSSVYLLVDYVPGPAGVSVTPATATLTTVTFIPTVAISNNQLATPITNTLTTNRFAPTVFASDNKYVTPATATVTTATFIPNVTATNNQSVTPGVASITTATYAPTVSATANVAVTPNTASLTTASFAPVVSFTANQVVTPATATLTITPQNPIVAVANNQAVVIGTTSLTTTTFAPSVALSNNQLVTPATASLTTNRFAPNLTLAIIVTPSTASLATNRFAPNATATDNKIVTPTTNILTTSLFAPTASVSDNKTATPATASLTTSLQAPAVTTGNNIVVSPNTANLVTSTWPIGVTTTANQVVVPSTASLTITRYAPTISTTANQNITIGTTSLSLTTQSIAVSIGDNRVVVPATATFTTATFPILVATTDNKSVTPNTTSITISPQLASVTVNSRVTLQTATLIASLFAPTVTTTATTGQIKVWNGTAWVAKPVKVYTGTSWVKKPLKRWNGSAWVATNY